MLYSLAHIYMKWNLKSQRGDEMKSIWKKARKKSEHENQNDGTIYQIPVSALHPLSLRAFHFHSLLCFTYQKKKIFCETPLYILWESSWKLKIEIEKPTSNLVDRKFKILYNAFKISFLLVLETSSSDFTAWQERKKAFCICVADEMTLWVRRGDDENGRRTW